ncbi:MAG: DUF2007 domain-containing protein [Acidobacteria bacterium]|jgi:hypothetical protein|nr:DUF2007 domain-containing protein [Acidobacteriota bacterium]
MSTRYDFSDPEASGFCPECGLGFRTTEGRCADCDALLVTRAEALEEWRQSPPPDPAQRSVFLCSAPTLVETQLLRAQLESAGIPFVASDFPQVWGPVLGRDAEVRFFVEERDLARALEVLADVPPNEPPQS